MFAPLLLALAIDGDAALRHASRLAALGPHPWGSALSRGAAQYVEAQFRNAGLAAPQAVPFEREGIAGVNVVGTRPGPGTEIVVIGAHHDSAPRAPGAYDDGGGVGIIIEVARALAHAPDRKRTLMFVSFDGEEGWSRGVMLAGSRTFVEALGPRARDVTAMLTVEMSGWMPGTPCLHPIAYPDSMRPGRFVIAPAEIVRAALDGARRTAPQTAVGDRYLSYLYQPLVRMARVRLYGDDRAFLERGIPALMVSDSSFSAFYPWYHSAEDTADRLDPAALARMGNAVLGMVQALESAPRSAGDSEWFSFGGRLLPRSALLLLGMASLVPLLFGARAAGGLGFWLRGVQGAAFGVLLWRTSVVAFFCFTLANLLSPLVARFWTRLLTLLPLLAVAGLGVAAAERGMIEGLWLAPWELGLALLVTVIALAPLAPARVAGVRPARRPPRGAVKGRRAGLPKPGRR